MKKLLLVALIALIASSCTWTQTIDSSGVNCEASGSATDIIHSQNYNYRFYNTETINGTSYTGSVRFDTPTVGTQNCQRGITIESTFLLLSPDGPDEDTLPDVQGSAVRTKQYLELRPNSSYRNDVSLTAPAGMWYEHWVSEARWWKETSLGGLVLGSCELPDTDNSNAWYCGDAVET